VTAGTIPTLKVPYRNQDWFLSMAIWTLGQELPDDTLLAFFTSAGKLLRFLSTKEPFSPFVSLSLLSIIQLGNQTNAATVSIASRGWIIGRTFSSKDVQSGSIALRHFLGAELELGDLIVIKEKRFYSTVSSGSF
jgi:hypothetical protein